MPRLPEHRKTCHTIQLEEQAPITEATQGTHSTASELLVYMPQHSQENQAYMQSGPQQNIIQMRRDIEHNPHKYLSNTPSGVQGSESQPPDPHRQACLISVLRGGGALQYQSGSFSLINVGSGFHCLRSFFFLLFLCFRWDVVSLHPLSSAEYKTTSFPNPCR
jgi:hypothetical protein